MKKLFVLIAACAFALSLVACSGGASNAPKLGVNSDDAGVTITATGGITAEATSSITVPENGGVTVESNLSKGTIKLVYSDANGEVVFEDEWNEGEGTGAFGMDSGELTLTVKAEGAEGEITITSVDADALAAAFAEYDE